MTELAAGGRQSRRICRGALYGLAAVRYASDGSWCPPRSQEQSRRGTSLPTLALWCGGLLLLPYVGSRGSCARSPRLGRTGGDRARRRCTVPVREMLPEGRQLPRWPGMQRHRAAHGRRDRIGRPSASRAEKQQMPDGLPGLDRHRCRRSRRSEGAERIRPRSRSFSGRNGSPGDAATKRDHQRHGRGKQRSRMRGRAQHSGQHSRTGRVHRRRARSPPVRPAEAIERRPLAPDVGNRSKPATQSEAAAMSHGVRLSLETERATRSILTIC